jgi:hypothetical protein
MTRQEMESLLESTMPREPSQFDPPSAMDWDRLRAKFGCDLGEDFRSFIELLAAYQFPGDVFNVSSGRTNGNDLIGTVYDTEVEIGGWDHALIPFYAIGNGDYFCLSRNECPASPVYYYCHDSQTSERYADSFEEWVRRLPEFLG